MVSSLLAGGPECDLRNSIEISERLDLSRGSCDFRPRLRSFACLWICVFI